MHGRLDLPDYKFLFAEFNNMPLASISNFQRRPLKDVTWVGTVYHGLPTRVCRFNPHPRGGYLAFLGRISPEKRPDRAVEIARRAGVKLRIAAKVDVVDEIYFRTQIEPLLSDPCVEFIGEIGEREKSDFLGNAQGLLFPIDWPEPFGLVLIEAMSCGTPCIAWRCGSVPEVVEHGVTGFVVDSIESAVDAVQRVSALDRRTVRARFEQRFSVERMAKDFTGIASAGRAERVTQQLMSREFFTGWGIRTVSSSEIRFNPASCHKRVSVWRSTPHNVRCASGIRACRRFSIPSTFAISRWRMRGSTFCYGATVRTSP